jgi:diguanylate cyclase (GGDEF)-like protein/PAS domain S-box-containing protein
MLRRLPFGLTASFLSVVAVCVVALNIGSESLACGFAALSIVGTVAGVYFGRNQGVRRRWIAAPLGLFVLFIALIIASKIRADEQLLAEVAASSAGNVAGDMLEQRLDSDVRALAQLADRMRTGMETDRRLWELDALNYTKDNSEFQAVEWIDTNLKVKWVEPLKGNEGALHLDLTFESRRRSAVGSAVYARQITVSRTIDLVQGGRGFLIYAPVFKDGRFAGMVAGVVRVDRFLHSLPAMWLSNHSVRIWDGGQEIYSNSPDSAFHQGILAQSHILPTKPKWQLDVAPTPVTIIRWLTPLPEVAKISGIALALLVAAMLLLWERANYVGSKESESRNFLETLSETSMDITYVLDIAQDEIVYCNRFGRKFLGQTNDNLGTPKFDKLERAFHPEDLPRLKTSFPRRRTANDGEVHAVEARMRRSDGCWRWVSLRECVLSRDAHGDPRLLLGTGHDITDHRLAAEEVRQSKAALDQVIDVAPIGMALVGLDGKWLRVNQAFCDLIGYGHDELAAIDFQTITHPEDLDADLAQVQLMVRGEIQSYSMEKRYFTKQGGVVWALLTVAAFRDSSGQPSHFISQIQDITERKQMESQLLQRQEILARQTSELTVTVEQLESENRTDALTGLYNRRWFSERLDCDDRLFTAYGMQFAIIMLDVDHFKSFNDTYGHDVGDDVLRSVGRVVRENIRDLDLAARYGGEEFAIICSETSLDEAADIAERVRLALQRITHFPRPITASFGIAAFGAKQPNASSVLRAADRALYRAKSLGRNQVCRADEEDADAA